MGRPQPIAYVPLATADGVFVGRLDKASFRASLHPPHRHDYQEIIWVEEGEGRHAVDGQSLPLAPRVLSFVARGQVHAFERADGLRGYYLRFVDEFLPTAPGPTEGGLGMRLGGWLDVSPDDAADLGLWFRLIVAEYERAATSAASPALACLVAGLLARIDAISPIPTAAADPSEIDRFHRFVEALERSYATHHDVLSYAAAVGTTPDRLARLVRRRLGKTPKQAIDERVMLEARRLLRFTELPVKTIAADLGFADPFHFSKAFKRATGRSPIAYRAQPEEKPTSEAPPLSM